MPQTASLRQRTALLGEVVVPRRRLVEGNREIPIRLTRGGLLLRTDTHGWRVGVELAEHPRVEPATAALPQQRIALLVEDAVEHRVGCDARVRSQPAIVRADEVCLRQCGRVGALPPVHLSLE